MAATMCISEDLPQKGNFFFLQKPLDGHIFIYDYKTKLNINKFISTGNYFFQLESYNKNVMIKGTERYYCLHIFTLMTITSKRNLLES